MCLDIFEDVEDIKIYDHTASPHIKNGILEVLPLMECSMEYACWLPRGLF